MSSILEAPPSPVSSYDEAPVSLRTLEDLMGELGRIPLSRVRLSPPLGQATETDLLHVNGKHCELVDGVIVERASDFWASRLATMFLAVCDSWMMMSSIGFGVSGGVQIRLREGLVRTPSACFVHWDRIGSKRIPRAPIATVIPNFVLEMVGHFNTRDEMARKRDKYFAAGVELVWIVHPRQEIVEVWTTSRDCHIAGIDDTLDGGTVLPGFTVSVREWFQRAKRGQA